MKTKSLLLSLLLIAAPMSFSLSSCKSAAKAAAKVWTKRQVKKFKKKCKGLAEEKFKSEKAIEFCDCAAEKIMEKYPKADEALNLSLPQMISAAGTCVIPGLNK